MRFAIFLILAGLCGSAVPGHAQENAHEEAVRRQAVLAHLPADAARRVFGLETEPSQGQAHVIGFYAHGCLAGARELPIDGPDWQVMRLSRNRNWGHPALIRFLEDFARQAAQKADWRGLMVGDMSQPRGGPMLTGHASHQIGLDADIWFRPMPARRLSRTEREEISATNLVSADWRHVDPAVWSARDIALLRMAAQFPQVERIFVNPAIKQALCQQVTGDRAWLSKIRPMWGHNYHFHVRLKCPPGETACRPQTPPGQGDGCDKTLAWWFTPEAMHPKPHKPRPPLRMAQMPQACQALVTDDGPASALAGKKAESR